MDDQLYYANSAPATAGIQPGDYIPPTHRQQLEKKRLMLQGELQRVNDALDALDAHPDLEKFTTTLQQALR